MKLSQALLIYYQIDRLSMVFVLIFAAVFLGEKLSLTSVAGVFLVAAGVVLLAL